MTEDSPRRRRLTSLDGLRGIAALVVVVHHTLLTSATLALAYTGRPERVGDGLARLVAFSPVHLLWAGREAVYVFFVLSGLVLTLPVLGERGRRWRTWVAYYPKRLVRLYVPVWGALVLSVALLALRYGHQPIRGASWWLNRHFVTLSGEDLRQNALLTSTSWLNSPLWSLHWEVVFSLLLPVAVLVGVLLRRWAVWAGLVAVAVSGWGGHLGDRGLLYLPMFVLGVLMATRLDDLLALGRRLTPRAWWVLVPLTLALLSSRWWITDALTPVLPLVGAVLTVFAFMVWRPAVRLGDLSWVQWLGTRSFSLYLVHEPIVVLVAVVLHAQGTLVVLAVALPASLLGAAAFYLALERPSHRLADVVGRAAGGRRSAERRTTPVGV